MSISTCANTATNALGGTRTVTLGPPRLTGEPCEVVTAVLAVELRTRSTFAGVTAPS